MQIGEGVQLIEMVKAMIMSLGAIKHVCLMLILYLNSALWLMGVSDTRLLVGRVVLRSKPMRVAVREKMLRRLRTLRREKKCLWKLEIVRSNKCRLEVIGK